VIGDSSGKLTDPESVIESCLFLLGRAGTIDLIDFGDLVEIVSYELLFAISIGLGIWSPGKKDSTRPPFSLASPLTFSAPSSNT